MTSSATLCWQSLLGKAAVSYVTDFAFTTSYNLLYFSLFYFFYTGPPFVILEFVPHGDLLGYLKKSKGETDDYYNLRGADVPQKIPTRQLYNFASDIARGMEFISAHQVLFVIALLFLGNL